MSGRAMSGERDSSAGIHHVSFGPDVVGDAEIRVCGDVRGKRVMELGIHGTVPNSVAFAATGAKTIAVDPSPQAISRLREAAERAEVKVECHNNELADLGFATSGALDLVLCAHQIRAGDDIPRLFRQVHRVLRTEAALVVAMRHPVAAMFDGTDPVARTPYGQDSPPVADLVMALQRANFAIDAMHELFPSRDSRAMAPSTLVLRARKLGS
jgi:ubiquinone/menaquinone biosynthesis C-methylase UbiE